MAHWKNRNFRVWGGRDFEALGDFKATGDGVFLSLTLKATKDFFLFLRLEKRGGVETSGCG
jgi:hypothetical protein